MAQQGVVANGGTTASGPGTRMLTRTRTASSHQSQQGASSSSSSTGRSMQRESSVRALCGVQVSNLLNIVRGNRKFQEALVLPPWEEQDGLCKLLNHLRHKLATGDHVTDAELFYPFLQVIRAKEVAGPATGKALEGVLNMLRSHAWDPSILRQVAEGVEQCKFEETSRDHDETVLYLAIEAFRVCVDPAKHTSAPANRSAVCELVFEHLLTRFHADATGDAATSSASSRNRVSVILRQASLRLLLDIVTEYASPEFIPFMVRWGVSFLTSGKDSVATDESRMSIAAAAIRTGIEHDYWASSRTSGDEEETDASAAVFVDAASREAYMVQIPFGILNALYKHRSAAILCTLLPLVNRLLGIAMTRGNALWVEAITVGCYLRLIQDHQKAVAYNAEKAAAAASGTGVVPTTSVAQQGVLLNSDALVVLLEHLEEAFSANPGIPAVLHSISDACYYKQQSCLELCKSLASLCSTLDTVTLTGQRSQRLSRAAGFAVMGLYYILKAHAELPTQVEVDRRREVLLGCIKKFEEKPKKARAIFEPVLAFLPDVPAPPHAKTEDLPEVYEEWAVKLSWLFKNSPLMPFEAVGEFFGGNNPDSTHCYAVFCAQFDMADMGLDVAMRILLQTFRLPKEAQQIDRLMKIFSHTFYARNHSEDNEDVGASDSTTTTAAATSTEGGEDDTTSAAAGQQKNKPKGFYNAADACFTLAFSVIMLNVDQYNPQVKNRMEQKDFVRNLRKCNENEDFDEDLLKGIFNRIRESEIRTPETGGFDSELMAGRWMHIFTKDDLNYPQKAAGTSDSRDSAVSSNAPSQSPSKRAVVPDEDEYSNGVNTVAAAMRLKSCWPKLKPLYRLGFLNYCGKDIFEALVRVLNLDRLAASPAFSCVESLWRLEDLDDRWNDHSKPSSCVQLLFSEGVQVFRNNAIPGDLNLSSGAAKTQAEQLLAWNRRPIKCLRVLFNFVALNPNRMVQDSSFVVVCILFALYSCWEEPQIPLYDPMLIPAGSKARRRASLMGDVGSGEALAQPSTPQNTVESVPPSPGNAGEGGPDEEPSHYVLHEEDIRAIADLPVHHTVWDTFFGVGRGRFPLVTITEQKTGTGWMFEKVSAMLSVMGEEEANGDDLSAESEADFSSLSAIRSAGGVGSGTPTGARLAREAASPGIVPEKRSVAEPSPPAAADDDVSTNASTAAAAAAPADGATPAVNSSSATATPMSLPVEPQPPQRTTTPQAFKGERKTRKTVATNAKPPDPLRPIVERAFHKCDPFNVFAKLNARQLNLLSTSIFLAMLHTWRGQSGAADGAGVAQASPVLPANPGGDVTVRPFQPPASLSTVTIGDGFEVLRFALRLCAKVAHCPIPQLRSAGKAVLETILCSASSSVPGPGTGAAAGTSSVIVAGGDKISVRTAALALVAVFRFKDLWGRNSVAEILSQFLERVEVERKLFVQLSMVACNAVHCFFSSVKHDEIHTLFQTSEEVLLVFRLLRAGYPSKQNGGDKLMETRGLKIEKIVETMMLLFHPTILPVLGLQPYAQCLGEIPAESPEHMCRLLLAMLRMLSNSGTKVASAVPTPTNKTALAAGGPSSISGSTSSTVAANSLSGSAPPGTPTSSAQQGATGSTSGPNIEVLAQIWCRTLIALCQNMAQLWLTLKQMTPAPGSQQAVQGFFQLLIDLQEVVLSETVSRLYTPYVGIQVVEKLVAFLTSCATQQAAPKNLSTLALNIASKFFLLNLKHLQHQPRFDQAWLMVLRLILVLHKQGRDTRDEVLAELTLETLKNVIRVLLEGELLMFTTTPPGSGQEGGTSSKSGGNNEQVWWRVTWENIENLCPGFRTQLQEEQRSYEEHVSKKRESSQDQARNLRTEQAGGAQSSTSAPPAVMAQAELHQQVAPAQGSSAPPAPVPSPGHQPATQPQQPPQMNSLVGFVPPERAVVPPGVAVPAPQQSHAHQPAPPGTTSRGGGPQGPPPPGSPKQGIVSGSGVHVPRPPSKSQPASAADSFVVVPRSLEVPVPGNGAGAPREGSHSDSDPGLFRGAGQAPQPPHHYATGGSASESDASMLTVEVEEEYNVVPKVNNTGQDGAPDLT
ncbi:unnamed protein product [Amoebophrya sp. A120]|nr:unnamed protein product [Amoebophrya sp. A120]|eukprot:GSA120T00005600001.1